MTFAIQNFILVHNCYKPLSFVLQAILLLIVTSHFALCYLFLSNSKYKVNHFKGFLFRILFQRNFTGLFLLFFFFWLTFQFLTCEKCCAQGNPRKRLRNCGSVYVVYVDISNVLKKFT